MKLKFTNKKKNSGLTLMETLVAISILMTAVAAPLAISAQSLVFANFAKNQISAFYLAQEVVEVVRNIRDENIKNGESWLKNLNNCKGSGKICLLDVWKIGDVNDKGGFSKSTGIKNVRVEQDIDSCKDSAVDNVDKINFFDDGSGQRFYGHVFNSNIIPTGDEASIKPSSFKRFFKISDVSYSGGVSQPEIKLSVFVCWKDGAISREVKISENLFDLQ